MVQRNAGIILAPLHKPTSQGRKYSSMANLGPQRRSGAANSTRAVFSRTIVYSALICAIGWALPAPAQKIQSLPADPSTVKPPQLKDHFLIDRLPEKPTVPPVASIPLDPLDFATPNPVYLGHRYTMASLDFLDENHLLFTFRVPGLIRRTPGNEGEQDEHNIRAVVLSIPSGSIMAQTTWVLHGRDRYIWPLKDGQFLIRDGRELSIGDARLQPRPFLSFPGDVLSLAMDPREQYLVTNSREPVPAEAKTGASQDGSVDDESAVPDLVLRVFRRSTGDVLNVTRVRAIQRIPINSQGILQALRGYSNQWTISLDGLHGGTKQLATVVSQCMPRLEFISESELLATTCKPEGGYGLIAITTGGQMLWQDSTSGYSVWPILRRCDAGLRFLHETLAVTREIGAYWALDRTDVKAQRVRVIDAANGNVAFEATTEPALDAGGNAAISPSGRRVALLSNGHIQIFNLPPPPPLPEAARRATAQ
jgi:hypothetical protein